MNNCKICGSYAINPDLHGREPSDDLDLCDVCYWRKRAEIAALDAREACAMVCDDPAMIGVTAEDCAAAIRAQQKKEDLSSATECALGCAVECVARLHGNASECPALPWVAE